MPYISCRFFQEGGSFMANREYRSDVFSMLMEEKENALQIYNAVNGSHYDDPEQVQICTLEKGISLSMRNDAAFVLDANLSVYEHQSTVCPNMPLRSLIYVAELLRPTVRNRNIFYSRLLKIPTPRFVVFYNGVQEEPEQYEMRLSDAFEHETDKPELELICKIYNINKGKNRELLQKCPVLAEYMTFVGYVRQYIDELEYKNLEQAIHKAIDRCIGEGVLKEFLLTRREEVTKMTQLDYTFERQIMMVKRDCREEGIWQSLIRKISKKKAKHCTVSETADMLETEEDLVQKVYDALETYDADTQWEDIMELAQK
jgi:hypothetical protein